MHSKRIELLAPARDLETGRVAVDCGADAVYIGGPGFGARRAAGNSVEDIAALVRYARPFGVRVYAALNTLLFDDELNEARHVARSLIDAGIDALIVQDMAWLRMGAGRPTADPGFADELSKVELHASTQVSNIAPEEVVFWGRAGFRRVILERALSLDRIGAIRAACPEEVELEMFVHGAICVGYSGRCFLSRSMDAARSGNRGDCSQPCRLAWDLADSDGRTIIKGKHLLSVRDLDLSARLGELLDAGVTSFKIEGRLKDAGYVRNVVSRYRAMIDKELALRPELRRASAGISNPDFTPDPAKSFTRGGGNGGSFASGGTEYYFSGPRCGVASFDTPKAVGEAIGRVGRTGCERTGNRWFTLDDPSARLAAGDGICFWADGELQGTGINRVEGGRVYPDKGENIRVGTEICRNYDRMFARALERSRMKRRIGATARMSATPSRVEITFTDEAGVSVTVVREGVFEPAHDPAKMAATAREQLSKSGDTIFEVGHVEISGAQNRSGGVQTVFVPVSTLTGMRREGLERLYEARARLAPERRPAAEDPAALFPRSHLSATENVTNHLAECFYRDHGVTEIEPALELRDAGPGETVMRTRYCIRREIGECLREETGLRGDLHIEHGRNRYALAFDCDKCEMTVKKI